MLDLVYGTVPETVLEIHNRVAGNAVREIVYPTILAGGSVEAVLVLLESVVAGVLVATVQLGGDGAVLDALQHGVRERMAAIRLGDLPGLGGTH